ncbi:MAG: metallophosphoesterase [Thermoanaerobaculia bacterium]
MSLRLRRRPPPPEFAGEAALRSGRFAVVSDFQRTSPAELWRERNRDERRLIVGQIARESPDFLIVLGDLVFSGSSPAHWAEFDVLTAPLREAGIPILPVLGNHEYWMSPGRALPAFFARFPHLAGRHWYSVAYGGLGLLFLDSNRRWLAAARWEEQLAWYRAELARLDADHGVRGALVLLHHPPYTNSTVTSDERHVQRYFVPAFAAAAKTLAMFSGHVHSYERFERSGKTFCVTGGGGGPRVRLATGVRRRHKDDRFAGPPVRLFHYLLVELSPNGLAIEARGLPKRGKAFEVMERFLLPWPDAAAAGTG